MAGGGGGDGVREWWRAGGSAVLKEGVDGGGGGGAGWGCWGGRGGGTLWVLREYSRTPHGRTHTPHHTLVGTPDMMGGGKYVCGVLQATPCTRKSMPFCRGTVLFLNS